MSTHANFAYRQHLKTLRERGILVSPRGFPTFELVGHQYRWLLAHPFITCPGRAVNLGFSLAEIAWIISGDNTLAKILPFNRNMAQFSDDGEILTGAYGPPLVDQLSHVISTLQLDRLSRQAVLTLWRPRPGPSKDIPCTLSLQFLIRSNMLELVVSMRSSDAWLGLPYDQATFSVIAAYVAGRVGADRLGNGYLTAGSAHLYKRDFEECHHSITAADPEEHSFDEPLRPIGLSRSTLAARCWTAASLAPAGRKAWKEDHREESSHTLAALLQEIGS